MPPLRRSASLLGIAARSEPLPHRDTQPRQPMRIEGESLGAAAAVELPPRPGSSGIVPVSAGAARTEAQPTLPEAISDHGRARLTGAPSAHPVRPSDLMPPVGLPPLVARPVSAHAEFAPPKPETLPPAERFEPLTASPSGILTPLMVHPALADNAGLNSMEQLGFGEDAGHRPPQHAAPQQTASDLQSVRHAALVNLPTDRDMQRRSQIPPPPSSIPPPPNSIPPPPNSAAPAPVAIKPERLGHVALIDDNGAESIQFPLVLGENRIGSGEGCQLRFPDDGFLTPVHCVIDVESGKMTLRPVDYGNGVFVRIATPVELHHGDTIRIGQEVLRFERLERLTAELNYANKAETVGFPLPREVWGRLCQIGLGRQVANAYLLGTPDVFLGRERGDILFPRDGFVSGSHAVVSERNGRCFLKDLVSSNGTFVKAKQASPLRNGDLFLLGRNLLRVHLGPPA